MLDGHPVIPREFVDDPFAAKPTDAAVLLASEWTRWRVVITMIVHVGHAGLHTQRKSQTPLFVASKYGTRKSVLSVVRNSQSFSFSIHFDNRGDRAKQLVLSDLHLVLDIHEYVRR